MISAPVPGYCFFRHTYQGSEGAPVTVVPVYPDSIDRELCTGRKSALRIKRVEDKQND